MARGYTERKLEVFSVHVRQGRRVPNDYGVLFSRLSKMSAERRIVMTDDKLVALPRITADGDHWLLTAYEGAPEVDPLIFNSLDASERYARLAGSEVVATKTHGIFNPASREAIIEYNHRGAKAGDIAEVLAESLRASYRDPNLVVDLNPVVDETFIEAIDSFARIRVASIRIVRPNYDWTDYADELTDSAGDSNAHTVMIEFTASRGDSLESEHGVIPFIKRLASGRRSIVKNARVAGTREGEDAETTVSLGNFIAHQKVAVRLTRRGHVEDNDIERRLRAFMAARPNTATDQ